MGEGKLFLEGEFFFEFFQLTSCSATFALLLLSMGHEKDMFSTPALYRVKTTWNLFGGKLSLQAPFSSNLSSLSKSFLAF